MDDELTLEELAKLSRMPLRTLRYYITEGLLVGPDTRGKNASYPRLNLERLEMILRLKERFLPLQEIKILLDNMSEADLRKMLSYQERVSTDIEQIKADSHDRPLQPDTDLNALDYIKSLEQAHGMLKSVSEPQDASEPPLQVGHISSERFIDPIPRYIPKIKEESWRRIIITEGLELNVQSNRETELEAALEKLIEFSRTLFDEN